MNKLRITAILLMLSGNVLADPQPWMVKENPDQLYVFVEVRGDCPGDYDRLMDRAFARAKIRRKEGLSFDEIIVRADIRCLEISTAGLTARLDVEFATYTNNNGAHPTELISYVLSGLSDLLTLPNDAAGAQFLERAVEEAVDELLTDYLQANFDL